MTTTGCWPSFATFAGWGAFEGFVAEASIREIDRPEDSTLHQAAMKRYEAEIRRVRAELKEIEDRVRPDFSGVEHDEFQYEMNRVPIIEKQGKARC